MKKFLLGIVIGIIMIFAFIYFGGGSALKSVGTKTIELGKRIEMYEKFLKETTEGFIKKKEGIIDKKGSK
jgi:hypothetical protein